MDFQEFKDKYQKVPVKHYSTEVAENPAVSVCVTTYQHVDYIEECIESILMQETDFPFEILIGEDDSSDGTRDICLEYAEEYPEKIRLFLHHRENNIKWKGRATGSFNLSYNLFSAKGKYIAVCEGDDYWTDPLKLQKQVDFMEANKDCSISTHSIKKLFADSGGEDYVIHARPPPDTQKCSLTELLNGSGFFASTQAIMFKAEIVLKLPYWFFRGEISDIPLNLICACYGKIGYLPEVMAVYRKFSSDDAWSSRHRGRGANGLIEYVKQHNHIYDMFDEYTQYQYHKAIQKTKWKITTNQILRIQKKFSRKEQLKCIKYFPKTLLKPKKINVTIWGNFIFGCQNFLKVRSLVSKFCN